MWIWKGSDSGINSLVWADFLPFNQAGLLRITEKWGQNERAQVSSSQAGGRESQTRKQQEKKKETEIKAKQGVSKHQKCRTQEVKSQRPPLVITDYYEPWKMKIEFLHIFQGFSLSWKNMWEQWTWRTEITFSVLHRYLQFSKWIICSFIKNLQDHPLFWRLF